MKTTIQQPNENYIDFIIRNYGDVRYLPYYINETGINYDDFTSGITLQRTLPEITLTKDPIFNITFPKEFEDITIKKTQDQTLLDISLQNYGSLDKVLDNLKDSNTTQYDLYRDYMQYKKIDKTKSKLGEEYKRLGTKISTKTNIIEIIHRFEVISIYGDFADDFSNDYKI